ncbi:ClpP/crotonase [Backusella circina FSU 941]|nr:ClpP/crotonase [Backusella circina FSU 941]
MPLEQLFSKPLVYKTSLKMGSIIHAQQRRLLSNVTRYKLINVETKDKVALVTLNRPEALNALNNDIIHEVNDAFKSFDNDDRIGAIVLTGSKKAFAAGADIKEMMNKRYVDTYTNNLLGHWAEILKIKKPVLAAINGYALGGGCELAMACDILYAGENAVFGQPEIKLGIIPGGGGSQRLIRAIGKSKAMEMILGGSMNLDAQKALQYGLVSKVFPVDDLVDETVKVAQHIADRGIVSVQLAKTLINQSYEIPLRQGLHAEITLFQSLFGTEDQKKGMQAFVDKTSTR